METGQTLVVASVLMSKKLGQNNKGQYGNGVTVYRTCAHSYFQPVFNLAVECAVNQFQHWCQCIYV